MRLVQGQQNKTKQVAGRLDREITGVASAPFQSFVALSGKRKDTGQRTSLAGQAAAAFIPAHVRDGENSLTNFSGATAWLTLWDPIHGNLHGAREVNFEQSEDIIINPVAPDERVVQVQSQRCPLTPDPAPFCF